MYLLHHLPTIRSSHNSCNPTKMTNTHGDTLDSDCRKYSQGGLHPSPTAVNYVHGDRPIGSAVTASERTGKHARRCDGSKSPNHGDEGGRGFVTNQLNFDRRPWIFSFEDDRQHLHSYIYSDSPC